MLHVLVLVFWLVYLIKTKIKSNSNFIAVHLCGFIDLLTFDSKNKSLVDSLIGAVAADLQYIESRVNNHCVVDGERSSLIIQHQFASESFIKTTMCLFGHSIDFSNEIVVIVIPPLYRIISL